MVGPPPSRMSRPLAAAAARSIASNVVASRLAKLTDAGLVTRNPVEGHRQKIDYLLTEAAIELVPLFVELGAWGYRWLPTAPELGVRARLLADGGRPMSDRFMDELRVIHLDRKPRPEGGVLDELDTAYRLADGLGVSGVIGMDKWRGAQGGGQVFAGFFDCDAAWGWSGGVVGPVEECHEIGGREVYRAVGFAMVPVAKCSAVVVEMQSEWLGVGEVDVDAERLGDWRSVRGHGLERPPCVGAVCSG